MKDIRHVLVAKQVASLVQDMVGTRTLSMKARVPSKEVTNKKNFEQKLFHGQQNQMKPSPILLKISSM